MGLCSSRNGGQIAFALWVFVWFHGGRSVLLLDTIPIKPKALTMTSQTTHIYHRPLHFSETDAAGVAHFSRIAAIIEEAEHDYFHSRGVLVVGPNFAWPRIRLEIEYRSPCSFGDLLEVRISNPLFTTSTLEYEFLVLRSPAPGEPDAAAEERVVCDGRMKVCHVVRDPAYPTGLRSEPIADVVKERLARPSADL